MAYDGATWNEAIPDNDTVANTVDDHLQDVKKGVRVRMAVEHIWPASQTASGQAGMHSFITLQKQAAKPTLVAASSQVAAFYVTSSGTGYNFMLENSAGTEIPLLAEDSKIPSALLGNYTPTATSALTGSVIQVVSASTAGAVACATTIPSDDSIPQVNAEGTLISGLNLAVTPTGTANQIILDGVIHVGAAQNGDRIAVAVSKDTTAGAVAVFCAPVGNNAALISIPIHFVATAASTAERTYKFYVGGGAGVVTVNGDGAGNRLYGGAAISRVTAKEVKA